MQFSARERPVLYRLVATVCFLFVGPSFAQQPQRQATQGFTSNSRNTGGQPVPAAVLRATTRLVLIDGIVMNKRASVPNLKYSDFQLFENGKLQQIRFFSYHPATPVAPTAALKPQQWKPGMFSNMDSPQESAMPPVIILLDALNTDFVEWAYAREQTITYLKSLQPGRGIAVFLLNRSLHVLQDFTTNPSQAEQALINNGNGYSRPASHNHVDTMVPDASQQISGLLAQYQSGVAAAQTDMDKIIADSAVGITLDALQQIARSAAGFRGRKNLIWISSSFPLYVREGPNGPIRSYSELLHTTSDALADAQIAVYPIDPHGLTTPAIANFSTTGTSGNGSLLRGSALASSLSALDSAVLPNHDSMNQIAQETGGKANYTSNFVDAAIARAANDGSDYYTLGYYPQDQRWNGGFRKVEVKLVHLPAQIRARSGYYAIDADEVSDEATQRQQEQKFSRWLRLGAPEMRALPFAVDVIPPQKPEDHLKISYFVPSQAVSFRRDDSGGQFADLEFAVEAFDSMGRQITTRAGILHAPLTTRQASNLNQEVLHFVQDVSLPAGTFNLKVGVLDIHSGLMGTLSAEGHVSVSPAPALVLRQRTH
jgi:VWFA-related protein